MALDFGGNIFPRPGLYNDDGMLRERWGQIGSILKSWISTTTGSLNMYTVPAGRVVYVTQLTACSTATQGNSYLRETVTTILMVEVPQDDTVAVMFKVPIQFTAGEIINISQQSGITTGILGWEEDA